MSTIDRSNRAHLDADQQATWRAFLEAHARLTEVLGQELKEAHDLPLAWYDVLVQLSEAGGDWQLRMQDLAQAVLLSKSGLTRLVDRMQGAGLVERVACEDDRRGTYARLTPRGYATLKRCAPSHADSVARHFAEHIASSELDTVRDVLGRIAEALRDDDVPRD